MAPRWSHDSAKMEHDGAKLGHDGARLENDGAVKKKANNLGENGGQGKPRPCFEGSKIAA